MTDLLSLRERLPRGPWRQFTPSTPFIIVAADGRWIANAHSTSGCATTEESDARDAEIAEAIRQIPDMLTELARSRAIHESDQACIRDALAELDILRVEDANMEDACRRKQDEIDRLRALNAEMREALIRARGMLEIYEQEETGESFNDTKINDLLTRTEES